MYLRFLSATLFALLLAWALPFVPTVLAQTGDLATVGASSGLGNANLLEVIGTIINVFLGLLGIIFLVLMLYSGFLWMTAAGSEDQVVRAKRMIINAVVGLIITMSAYAIATFVINLLEDATGTTGTPGGSSPPVTVEHLSGSLGSGPIQDHYPNRNQTNVVRNTNIIVTFKYQMDIESLIDGYDTNGTPLDTSDDTLATAIRTDRVKIYASADGAGAALSNVDVSFSPDLKTFVFNPVDYLGSPTENVSYTIVLDKGILDANGNKIFTGAFDKGYEWSFETGVNLDLDPPSVQSIVPVAGGSYAKNIVVQVTFDEAVDPTSATGTRLAGSGFQNIQVAGGGGSASPTPGTFSISNNYKTITFETSDSCGTNSCNEEIFCLPGGQEILTTIRAATLSSSPPQALGFPYDGVVDLAANSLDGNNDGTAGDAYAWSFNTTNEIFLLGSTIESITPNILESNVALDQDIDITFSDVVMSSTVNSDNLFLTNKELSTGTSHEQWYSFKVDYLTATGEVVTNKAMIPAKSLVHIPHGVFLESVDGKTYVYGVETTEGVKNEYQNCYLPAAGPDRSGGSCAVSASQPYCCNGTPSASACVIF